ncbi:hypothetical protein GW17_00047353 [Ensete ventricosum]|nr:hypothetical protein GW17_00047353 [Ensete ventricosum]RZR85302.1 hypothetical protein BHM03_00012261 [Ensete ventricosum]
MKNKVVEDATAVVGDGEGCGCGPRGCLSLAGEGELPSEQRKQRMLEAEREGRRCGWEEEGLANDSSRCVKDGRRRGAAVAVAMTRVVARATGSGQRGNSCCGNDKGYSEGRQERSSS